MDEKAATDALANTLRDVYRELDAVKSELAAEKGHREQAADNYLQSVSRWNTEKARLRDHIANAGRRAEQAEAERDEAYADIDRLHAEIARLLRWVIARACEIGGANCAKIVKEAHNRA